MAEGTTNTLPRPFTTFNFSVEIDVPGLDGPLCAAAFAECDGLEITMEPKTIREGGNNARPIHLSGPISYGRLTLKRGMTDSFDLWDWFDQVSQSGGEGLRGTTTVVLLGEDRTTARMTFELTGCLPVKLKAPAFSANQTQVAIEEVQIAYERLRLVR